MSGFVLLLSGAPGVGKTEALKQLASLLQERILITPVLVEDNEWAFSPAMRALCANKSGMTINSPEFAKSFNRQGQIDYQKACRQRAAQGFDVIMPGPFEDLTAQVPLGEESVPLYRKLELDFDNRIQVFQLILVPRDVEITSQNVMEEPAMEEVEQIIQGRLDARASRGDDQVRLDADKRGPFYYRERLRKQLISSEMFPEITKVLTHPGETPTQVAEKLLEAFQVELQA